MQKTDLPFSQDNSKYKNIIKDFYKSEMAREKLPGYEDYDSKAARENDPHGSI